MSLSVCYATNLTQVKFPHNLSAPLQLKHLKRKRAQEPENPPVCAPTKRLRKRSRTSFAHSAFGDTFGQLTAGGVANNKTYPIAYWVQKESWPKRCFEQNDQTRRDLEKDSWLEEYWEPESNMNQLLARKKSSSSLRGNDRKPALLALAIKSQGTSKVPHTKMRVMKLYLRPKAASWVNPNWVPQLRARACAEPSSRLSKRFRSIPYFAIIYSKKLARWYGTKMRRELSAIFCH